MQWYSFHYNELFRRRLGSDRDYQVNSVQLQLGCCGVVWYRDWSFTSNFSSHSVPDSCCRVDVVGCGHNILQLSLEEVSFNFNVPLSLVLSSHLQADGCLAGYFLSSEHWINIKSEPDPANKDWLRQTFQAFSIIHINGCYEIFLSFAKSNKAAICFGFSGLLTVQVRREFLSN